MEIVARPVPHCLTCFGDAENCGFFTTDEGPVAAIVKQHFWFTDPELRDARICEQCWSSIDLFHKFYASVEKLYEDRLLGSECSLKQEEGEMLPELLLIEVANELADIKEELDSADEAKVEIEKTTTATATTQEEVLDEATADSFKEELDYESEEETESESDGLGLGRPRLKRGDGYPDEYIRKHITLSCEHCEATDLTFKQLFTHVEKVHGIKINSVTCCGTKYHTRIRLFEHVQYVFDPEAFKCKQCGYVCNNGLSYKRHLRVQHGEGVPVRPYNNANRLLKLKTGVFAKSEEQLKKEAEVEERRQKRQREDKLMLEHVKFECVPCGVSVGSFAELFGHFREEHKRKPVVTCCGNRFNSRQRLLQHVQSLKNPIAFRCEMCFRCFRNEYAKNKHKFEMHPTEEDLKYKCDRCPKVFVRELKYKKHMQDHEDCDAERIKCEDCGKMFKSHHILYMHVRKKHREPQFVCDICAKAFHLQSEFKRHKIEHENPDQLKMQCQHCLRWFKNREYWRAHVRMHVVGEVKCEQCGRMSPNLRAHRAHVKNTHGVRNKKCTWCGKCFNKDINLREHVASRHTGDMLYTCSFCPKTFNSNANMHSHRKKMHPVEWLAMRESAAEAQMPAGAVAMVGYSATGGNPE